MTPLSRPLHRSEHTGSRGGIPATPICTTSSPQKKKSFFWKKGFFSGFTKRQMHIAGPFFHLIQTASTLTKDRTGAVRAARRHAYGSIAPRSAEFNAQEADRLRPDICGPTRPNIDSPDRAAFIDFCECLRSVKQSRRLNLQCSQPYLLMHLGVCHCSCSAST